MILAKAAELRGEEASKFRSFKDEFKRNRDVNRIFGNL